MDESEQIYQRLIAPIEERMMRTIARMVRDPDDASDAFQNALAGIWKNLEKIDRHPNPHGYILKICINAAYDVLRKRTSWFRRSVPLDSAGPLANPPDEDSPVASLQLRQAVFEKIASLPRKQAQIVILRAREDQSYSEIARIVGCTEATARSHFSKGISRLRLLCKNMKLE